jgi:UDP-N-acetylglucosamine:LPS N-acetylglucosamine transferase
MDVLIISSPGGHSVQASIIYSVFKDDCNVDVEHFIAGNEFREIKDDNFKINDCNFNTPLSCFFCLIRSIYMFSKLKPKIVISTGAAPGCIFLLVSRCFGSKCIWVDSIANIKNLSLSGRIAQFFCNDIFTQWEHLSSKRIKYIGSVI